MPEARLLGWCRGPGLSPTTDVVTLRVTDDDDDHDGRRGTDEAHATLVVG